MIMKDAYKNTGIENCWQEWQLALAVKSITAIAIRGVL